MNKQILFNQIRAIVLEELILFDKDTKSKVKSEDKSSKAKVVEDKKEKSEEGSDESKGKPSSEKIKSTTNDIEKIKYEDLPKITSVNAKKIKILEMNGSSGTLQLDNKIIELVNKKQVISFITDWLPMLSVE